ncbi:MAG: glutamate--tRNA ligase [Thermoplasmatota archaeon]
MTDTPITQIARNYALQNAVQFNGTANEKAVIGKVIAALKKQDISPKKIIPIVKTIIQEVNQLSLEQQKQQLQQSAPELLVKEKKVRDFSLPPLQYAEEGKVVTRFPPEPNGYLHIGHAKAAFVDYEYAKIYDGIFILRFDDTNPENAHHKFYEVQQQDLQWLGITWDKQYNTSDNIPKHYKLAEQLITQNNAYICTCKPADIKDGRFNQRSCTCRSQQSGETLDLWKKLLSSGDMKGAILRLKANMNSANTAMRDPTLFRVIEKEHPLQGAAYRVWPTYDFTGAIEDSISGVTHPFRTKEYELRDEVYYYILTLLNLRKPHLMEFSRLSIEGMPVSKRKIKPLIEQQLVTGYDDIRLPTIRGLQKRGIMAQAIKQFVFSQGISKVESTVDFSVVESYNRKLLDPQAKRYYFVSNPIQLQVINAPKTNTKLKLHPTTDLGERTIQTESTFYIPKEDIQEMKPGDIFRLKGLYNVKVKTINTVVTAIYEGEELISDTKKIQWTTTDYIKMTLYIPHLLFTDDQYNPKSLTTIEGYAEQAIKDIPDGEIVQFERVGFARIEKNNQQIIGYVSHK